MLFFFFFSCGLVIAAARSSPQEKELVQWLSEAEMNVSAGSFWLVLAGNASSHDQKILDIFADGSKLAETPNILRDETLRSFEGCHSEACAHTLSLDMAEWLRSRDRKYGIAVLKKAEHTALWLLKVIATYWWGQRKCSHPLLLTDAIDCERIVWILSTEFGSSLLIDYDHSEAEQSRQLARAVRDHWSGTLGLKASRRSLFLRGQMSPQDKQSYFDFLQNELRKVKPNQNWFANRFVGQTGVVADVALHIDKISRRIKSRQPVVFYFYGSAGSGKSRMAKLIAEKLQRPFIQLQMESYNTELDVNRFFGAPAAYEQGGVSLVDELLRAPNAVLLLDEIEKAHQSILSEKLHNALSAGVMTHKQDLNRSADISHAIFVFTTNCFENHVQQVVTDLIQNQTQHNLYAETRAVLEVLINDAPRIPCSSTKSNPFEDASLRSRIPRSKQFPFLPLTKQDMEALIPIEFNRLAHEFNLSLAWSPKLPAAYLTAFPYFADARALVEKINDDFDYALYHSPVYYNNSDAIIRLSPDGTHFNLLWVHADIDDTLPKHTRTPSLSMSTASSTVHTTSNTLVDVKTSCVAMSTQSASTDTVPFPDVHESFASVATAALALVAVGFVGLYALWFAVVSPSFSFALATMSASILYAAYLTSPLQVFEALAALAKLTVLAGSNAHQLLSLLLFKTPRSLIFWIFLVLSLLFSYYRLYYRRRRTSISHPSSRVVVSRGTMTEPVRIIAEDAAFVVVPPLPLLSDDEQDQ